MEDKAKVYEFKKDGPIFSQEIRCRIHSDLQGQCENPQKIIHTVEQAICTHLVDGVSKVAERLGSRLSKSILSFF